MYTFAKALENIGINVEFLYLGNLKSISQLKLAQEKVRKASKYFDITHAQFGSACALATMRAEGFKILTLRGSDWHRYIGPHASEYLHGIMARKFTKLSIPSYDAVVTVSERMASEVRLNFTSTVVSIVDPIDLDLFKPTQKPQSIGMGPRYSKRHPLVLFTSLSSKNPVKRINLARQSISVAARSIPNIVFKIAENVPNYNMPNFVSSCDMILCTSTHEGWPNSVKEALACGLPFVSTDVSDLKSIASRRDDCFVGLSDPEILGGLIKRVLIKNHDPLSLRNEVKEFSLNISAHRLLKLYENTINVDN